jgi:hypothetical protein
MEKPTRGRKLLALLIVVVPMGIGAVAGWFLSANQESGTRLGAATVGGLLAPMVVSLFLRLTVGARLCGWQLIPMRKRMEAVTARLTSGRNGRLGAWRRQPAVQPLIR